jgi:hypothetical protein
MDQPMPWFVPSGEPNRLPELPRLPKIAEIGNPKPLKHGGKEDVEENGFGGNAKQVNIDEVLRFLAILAISRSSVHHEKRPG